MNPVYEKVKRCVEQIRSKTDFKPRVALVLGSGLGHFADTMKVEAIVDYKDIEGFPISTALGHVGRFIFGYVGETPVVCMQGRVHLYEGYEVTDVVLPIRVMGELGAETLFLTNASGGLGRWFHAGDLMLITDQITFLVPSPLRGPNIEELGERFPDMSHVYNEALQQLVKKKAAECDIEIKQGVYLQTPGPQYETPAEIHFARAAGADAVGMSTGVEAVAANHMGMKVVGISCVTNLAAGISPTPLSGEEVIECGKQSAPKFTRLVTEVIKAL